MTETLYAQRQRDLFVDLLKRVDDAKLARMVTAAGDETRALMFVEVTYHGHTSRATVPLAVACELLAEECRTRGLEVSG